MKKIIFVRLLFVLCAAFCIYRLFIYDDGSIMLDERIQFILVILTIIFVYLAVSSSDIHKLKSNIKYIFLMLFSTACFGLLFFTLFEKSGTYIPLFILVFTIYIAVIVISYIKKKKNIYYFLLYFTAFCLIVPFISILLFTSIVIFHHGNGQIIAEFILWVLEVTVFIPVIFAGIYKRYKLSLDSENILLKKSIKKYNKFSFIFFVCILAFNLLLSYQIYM